MWFMGCGLMISDDNAQWILMGGLMVSIGMIVLSLLLHQAMMSGYQSSQAVLNFPKEDIRELVRETEREVKTAADQANRASATTNFNKTISNYSNSIGLLYAAHGQMVDISVQDLTLDASNNISTANISLMFFDGTTTYIYEPMVIEC